MPITEIPPSPPSSSSPPPEPRFLRKKVRYEDLGADELFHVIDDLEGSRSRGRIREFIWISIIAHMVLFWYLAYGPRFFHRVQVLNPSDSLKDRQKDMTYLDLPNALKKVPPKTAKIQSDQDRTAEAKRPTIDRKTMEQLRAASKAAAPTPAPAPAAPQPLAPQVAQQPAPPKPSQPLQNSQLSQLDAPKPQPTAPSFNTGPATPGDAIRQAARDAAKSPAGSGGDAGPGAPNAHSGAAGGVDILSDTMGVDFDPYLKRIIYATERAWWPIIPEIARPPLNKQGKVLIRFKIMSDGSVKEMTLEGPSGDVSLDRAAWGGILGASPYPRLPKEFKGPYLELRFYFLYNTNPSAE